MPLNGCSLHFPFYAYIPNKGLKNLIKYEYNSKDHSLVSKYILQPFWSWLANQLPAWPAPNLITFVGFIPCMLSYLITAWYCPTFTEEAPRWLYGINFLCLFFYQTMDALDGKQARRTNTSSPLGELFDHGCDSLTIIFVLLTSVATLRCGVGPLVHWAVSLIMISFFASQWEEYFTNVLVLGYVGVTEAQIATLLIYVFAFIFGSEGFLLENHHILGLKISFSKLYLFLVIFSGIAQIAYNSYTVLLAVRSNKSQMKNALRFVGSVLIMISLINFSFYSDNESAWYNSHAYLLMIGFIMANLVGRVIVHRVCGLKASTFLELSIPLVIAIINTVLGCPFASNRKFILINCIVYFCAYMHFSISIIRQMTALLNINCFTIPSNPVWAYRGKHDVPMKVGAKCVKHEPIDASVKGISKND